MSIFTKENTMGKKKKAHKDRSDAPVDTGHDYRAKEAENHGFRDRRSGSDAPDGVSGNWS